MDIPASALTHLETYKIMVGSLVPRPIAWVTTLAPSGGVNAAPFSAFTWAGETPPLVVIGIGRRDDGQLKDTGRNIERLKEFVVNIGNLGLVTQLHQTANDYPNHVSEVTEVGLEVSPSMQIATPRLTAAPIAFECRLDRTLELGERKNLLVIGEVVHFHIRDGLMQDGKIDIGKLEPLGRLGGPNYASIGDIITMGPQVRSINKSLLK